MELSTSSGHSTALVPGSNLGALATGDRHRVPPGPSHSHGDLQDVPVVGPPAKVARRMCIIFGLLTAG
jgi:hypothetical protein